MVKHSKSLNNFIVLDSPWPWLVLLVPCVSCKAKEILKKDSGLSQNYTKYITNIDAKNNYY